VKHVIDIHEIIESFPWLWIRAVEAMPKGLYVQTAIDWLGMPRGMLMKRGAAGIHM
jgi:hypothetical protein